MEGSRGKKQGSRSAVGGKKRKGGQIARGRVGETSAIGGKSTDREIRQADLKKRTKGVEETNQKNTEINEEGGKGNDQRKGKGSPSPAWFQTEKGGNSFSKGRED